MVLASFGRSSRKSASFCATTSSTAGRASGHQLHLGLRGELGVGHLDRQHAGQAFAHVVAGDFDLGLLGDLVFVDVLVDDARHRRAQAGEVGAAVGLRNVVGEAQHLFGVAVVPLHRHFDADGHAGICRPWIRPPRVEHVGVQHGLGAVDVFDEAVHAAGEGEIFFLAGALVDQLDLDAVVEEGQFAQALGEDFVVEFDVPKISSSARKCTSVPRFSVSPRPSAARLRRRSRTSIRRPRRGRG
jgi:hypothetical protein